MGDFLQTQADKISSSVEQGIQNTIDNILKNIKDNMLNFLIYILKCLGTFVVETADITCPIICLLALAFYISGNRKAGKYISGSIVFYFIAMALKGVLRCKA